MRVTKNDLQSAVNLLNRVTGHNEEPYTKLEDGTHKANVGTYYLSGAYGGWALEQMVSESGGCVDTLNTGHIPKSQLYDLIAAYRKGYELRTRGG